jgi:hypothetical protein
MSAMSSAASSVDNLAWDPRVLQLVDPGVDGTLIAENLCSTLPERLRQMQEMARCCVYLLIVESKARDRNGHPINRGLASPRASGKRNCSVHALSNPQP